MTDERFLILSACRRMRERNGSVDRPSGLASTEMRREEISAIYCNFDSIPNNVCKFWVHLKNSSTLPLTLSVVLKFIRQHIPSTRIRLGHSRNTFRIWVAVYNQWLGSSTSDLLIRVLAQISTSDFTWVAVILTRICTVLLRLIVRGDIGNLLCSSARNKVRQEFWTVLEPQNWELGYVFS